MISRRRKRARTGEVCLRLLARLPASDASDASNSPTVMCSFDASYSIHIMLDRYLGFHRLASSCSYFFPFTQVRSYPVSILKFLPSPCFYTYPESTLSFCNLAMTHFRYFLTGLRFKTNIYMYENYSSPSNGFSQDQGRIFWAVNLGEYSMTIISRL